MNEQFVKYDVFIKQSILKDTELDMLDAAILDYLMFICNSMNEKIVQKRIEGFTWVNYKHLLKQMPLLRIKAISALSKRIHKIEKEGFIVINRMGNQDVYIKLTEKIDTLIMETKAVHEKKQLMKAISVEEQLDEKAVSLEKRIKNIYNTNKDSESDDSNQKSSVWLENKQYIIEKLEKFKKEDYNYPNKDGFYDWKYLLSHGECTPTNLFGALYWKNKEVLSEGIFKYQFKTKESAWSAFSQEKKNAKMLASSIHAKDFTDLMEIVDDKTFNEKTKSYDYEWKLSTILKNMHNY